MRKLFRLAVPVLAAAAIALGSGSSALAAATPEKLSLNDYWCFDDVVAKYCFDVTGHATFKSNQAGESLTVQQTTVTTVYDADGTYVGQSKSVEQLRGVFANDGTTVISSRIHTRSRVGEEDCFYRMILKIVDYELAVDHTKSTCTGPV